MKDTARRKACRQEAAPQLALMAMVDARATLHEAVVRAGITVLAAMLEEDRTKLCGPRYAHDHDRHASRAGYADGELAMGSRLVRVRRPRARSCAGEELALPTWERYARQDPLTPRAVEQMVLGVSTRNYARSVGPMPAGIASRGASKSAVSRRFVRATEQTLRELMGRDLSKLSICTVVIDGIHVDEHLVVAAVGVDDAGDKHVLGLHEGATENESVCTALIEDLVARGLRIDRTRLFVIDGSKAPLLVERNDDIPLIVRHLLRQKHAENPGLTRHLLRRQADGTEEVVPPYAFIEELMRRKSFDGNVRDLKVAVSEMLRDTTPPQQGGEVHVRGAGERDDPDEMRGRDLKKEEIEWALGKHDNNVSRAATQLGVSRASLYRAMDRVGVRKSS